MATKRTRDDMPFRQNVSTYTYDQICNRNILHYDIWLYQMADDSLYFINVRTAGGRHERDRLAWRALPDQLIPVKYTETMLKGMPRRIDDAWGRKRMWLSDLHWQHIIPGLRRVNEIGYHEVPSVWLHYVHTNLDIDDPMVPITNHYEKSDRRQRDDAMVTTGVKVKRIDRLPPRVVEEPSPWSARDRSVLRTLDKLLK